MRLHAMLLEYGTVAVAALLQPHTLPASCIMQTFSVVWYIFCVITYCKLVSLSAGYIILVLLYIFEFLVNVRCPPSRPGLQAHLSPAQLSLTLTPPADHGIPPRTLIACVFVLTTSCSCRTTRSSCGMPCARQIRSLSPSLGAKCDQLAAESNGWPARAGRPIRQELATSASCSAVPTDAPHTVMPPATTRNAKECNVRHTEVYCSS